MKTLPILSLIFTAFQSVASNVLYVWGGISAPSIYYLPDNTVSCSMGLNSFVVMTSDSQFYTGGDNAFGMLDIPDDWTNIIQCVCGNVNTVALRNNGTLSVIGYNVNGQTNVPASATNIASVYAGTAFIAALRKDGVPVVWGRDLSGETSVPTGATNVISLALGQEHVIALKSNGTLIGWGGDTHEQIDIPSSATNVVSIVSYKYHNAALRKNGTVVEWGTFSFITTNQTNMRLMTNARSLQVGNLDEISLDANGNLVVYSVLDDPNQFSFGRWPFSQDPTNVIAFSARDAHALVLTQHPRLGMESFNPRWSAQAAGYRLLSSIDLVNWFRNTNEVILDPYGLTINATKKPYVYFRLVEFSRWTNFSVFNPTYPEPSEEEFVYQENPMTALKFRSKMSREEMQEKLDEMNAWLEKMMTNMPSRFKH